MGEGLEEIGGSMGGARVNGEAVEQGAMSWGSHSQLVCCNTQWCALSGLHACHESWGAVIY